MYLKTMSVSQWIAVPDCPIQRDTERHASKAKHLLKPLDIHAVTFAAELPDGSLVKLDGHTRALLWKRNQVRHPPEVRVNVIPVKNIAEANVLYGTLDSKDALETASDKISGGFHAIEFQPKSGLLIAGGLANALRLCWNLEQGGFASVKGGSD